MQTIKTKGIVIKTIDYKETSKIVYCLTPIGKLSIKALGTKKYKNKNFNFGEVLNYVEMEITNTEFPSLVDFSIIDDFSDIKKDLKSFLWCSYLLEFLNKTPNDIPYERCLNYLINALKKITTSKDAMIIALMTQIKWLPLFGITPLFDKCMVCGNKPSFISVERGCSLCDFHKEYQRYLHDDIKRIYDFRIENDLNQLYDINHLMIFSFLEEYYKYHAELSLKGSQSLIF